MEIWSIESNGRDERNKSKCTYTVHHHTNKSKYRYLIEVHDRTIPNSVHILHDEQSDSDEKIYTKHQSIVFSLETKL